MNSHEIITSEIITLCTCNISLRLISNWPFLHFINVYIFTIFNIIFMLANIEKSMKRCKLANKTAKKNRFFLCLSSHTCNVVHMYVLITIHISMHICVRAAAVLRVIYMYLYWKMKRMQNENPFKRNTKFYAIAYTYIDSKQDGKIHFSISRANV